MDLSLMSLLFWIQLINFRFIQSLKIIKVDCEIVVSFSIQIR